MIPHFLFVLATAAGEPDRPNIILCMTDDQGWGDVSYNGLTKIKTPNLDAFAAAGLRFNRFYAAAPVCSPTRGSVLTGRHPNRYGTFLFGRPLRLQERTIAQAVKGVGYATGHFGKWHLNGVSGPGKPIAGDDPLSPGAFGFDEWVSVSNFYDLNPMMSRNGKAEQFQGDGSDIAADEAIKFIRKATGDKKPFLAVVWFGSPHNPHKALPEDLKAAGGSAYYGEIVAVDRAVGRLRSELRTLGAADNTIFWFCSDNGGTPAGSVNHLRGRKGTVYEGGVRVPGLLEWPARIRKSMTTDVPAVTSDIYPTVLSLLGIKRTDAIEPIDGIDLTPLIDGKMTQRPKPIGFWHYAGPTTKGGDTKFHKGAGAAALTDNRFKLVKTAMGKHELYDLSADDKESMDVSADHAEVFAKMKAELEAWQESVVRSYRGEDYRK